MGFFSSFSKGFQDTKEKEDNAAMRRMNSSYKTVRQEDEQRYDRYASKDDSALLREYRTTEGRNKQMIEEILSSRGYYKTANGSFDRRK